MRQSNLELLRILSMMAVIMVHLDGASVGLPTPGSLSAVSAPDAWRIVVESLTIVGVNCFTLISGYFGIRARIAGLLKFSAMCIFYSVILYSLSTLAPRGHWDWQAWGQSWMVFTHTDLWYVPAYLLLYLVSPFLNSAVDNLSLRRFSLWLSLFVIANVWCGWMWQANFNPTGYTPVQLIMMYLIGRWISRALPAMSRLIGSRHLQRASMALYLVAVAVTAFTAVWIQPTMAYAYNSPWVILSSVAIFTFFALLPLGTSSVINSLAKGAFAAYLIHKNPAVWGGIVRPTALQVWNYGSLTVYTGFTLAFTVAVYLGSSLADSFRRLLFRKFESLFDNEVKVET